MWNKVIEIRNSIIREIIGYCNNNPPQNAFSIFLCGGSGKDASKFRFSLGKAIEETQSQSSIFTVYYPETLFAEFLYGSSKRNLLDMEEILADNVSSIVLPLQSPGTVAELGAFASNNQLQHKIIVINRNKFSRVRSFINDGPIALLDKRNIIIDEMKPDKESIDSLKYKIRDKTKQIGKQRKTSKSLFDIRFILCVLIFVFDPISKADLKEFVLSANVLDQNEIQLLDSALGILGTNGYIHTNPKQEYVIVPKAFNQFLRKTGYNKEEIGSFQKFIDSYRTRALSYQLRKNYNG